MTPPKTKPCGNCGEVYEYRHENSRYCDKCKGPMRRMNRQQRMNRGEFRAKRKRCNWRGEWRDESEFVSRDGLDYGISLLDRPEMSVCSTCMPWTMKWQRKGNGLPHCEKCPLEANCQERVSMALDPACFAPDRRSLQVFLSLPAEEKRRAEELYRWRLGPDYQPEPDNIWRYFAHYDRRFGQERFRNLGWPVVLGAQP